MGPIDGQHHTGYRRRCVRSQEEYRSRDLLGLKEPADWHRGNALGRVGELCIDTRHFNMCGRDRVDPNALISQLYREGAREPDEPKLG